MELRCTYDPESKRRGATPDGLRSQGTIRTVSVPAVSAEVHLRTNTCLPPTPGNTPEAWVLNLLSRLHACRDRTQSPNQRSGGVPRQVRVQFGAMLFLCRSDSKPGAFLQQDGDAQGFVGESKANNKEKRGRLLFMGRPYRHEAEKEAVRRDSHLRGLLMLLGEGSARPFAEKVLRQGRSVGRLTVGALGGTGSQGDANVL